MHPPVLPAVAALALAVACAHPPPAPAPPPAPPVAAPGQLLAPAAFAAIADHEQRSAAMFVEVSRVLTHPRCVNCHPPDDTPRQGDRHLLHDPPVLRGAEDRGIPALGCNTCHQDRNAELARIPGAPDWHLAPREMSWLGKSPAALCAQL
ncbi:MAG TPA: Isoquinoline 1-oxidoreductase subunit, partial [Kofleriaceae bacterium]|nr:Isoquinoline 1-oxidoreductase subunit [Kofleriaceae bacterium]